MKIYFVEITIKQSNHYIMVMIAKTFLTIPTIFVYFKCRKYKPENNRVKKNFKRFKKKKNIIIIHNTHMKNLQE